MAMAVNAAKARLKRNQLAVGIGVRLVRNIDIIKVMKAAGFDWLFLDMEHGVMSLEACASKTPLTPTTAFNCRSASVFAGLSRSILPSSAPASTIPEPSRLGPL